MNEFVSLMLLHKIVLYYDAVAVGVLLAITTIYCDVSVYFAHKKLWCEHNKIKSLKDKPDVYRLFRSISVQSRKRYYRTAVGMFFKDYRAFLITVLMYFGMTSLMMGYIILC